jgi:hypothetical protein
MWVRAPEKFGEGTSVGNGRQAEKESQHWLTSLERTQQRVPENVTMVTIPDRKADIFDLIVFPRREGY